MTTLQMCTLRRSLLWATAAPIGLFVPLVAWALVNYPSTYVWRVVLWQDADVFDYQRFPERRIESAGTPFHFAGGSDEDEARVRALFETNPLIRELDSFLAETGTQAFIVIQNDRILYEKYFNGYERDSIVTSFSVAKSIVSALIGVAIEEGRIDSVDDPITKYILSVRKRARGVRKGTMGAAKARHYDRTAHRVQPVRKHLRPVRVLEGRRQASVGGVNSGVTRGS